MIKMIEYNSRFSELTGGPRVALYDSKNITDEEAWELVQVEQYHPHVIFMTKEQYLNVFGSILNTAP